MKSRTLTCITLMSLFAAMAVPVRLVTQEQQQHKKEHYRYKLIELGTFGGPISYINPVGNGGPYMNHQGRVVGSSMTSIPIPPNNNGFPCPSPPPYVFHAMEWSDSGVTDLGSLGEASNCSNAVGINDRGESVGTSENGRLDPATGALQLRAVLWKDGQIKNLGTFGGNHSYAMAINNRGQIVGFALNKVPDPFSIFDNLFGGSSSGTQTRAFLWQNGHKQDLDTLGGPDAWATFVNERGQVAGYSYINSTANLTTGIPTADPFLWTKEDGMIDLGTLGGTFGFPVGLNNRGQVIGQSNLAGDQNVDAFLWDGEKLIDLSTNGIGGSFIGGFTNAINDGGWVAGAAAFPNHPFDAAIWRNGVVTDLGVLPGDCASEALVLNSKGQVAGGSFSCDGIAEHAFLWEGGTMFDLTALISRHSGAQMVEPNAINDRGEIASDGLPAGCTPSNFSVCSQAYVLIPCDRVQSNEEGCEDEDESTPVATQDNSGPVTRPADATASKLTPEMLAALRARLARRYHILGLGAPRY